jgi:hypothetical protein
MRYEMKIIKKLKTNKTPLKCVFYYLISFQKERKKSMQQG